MLNEQIACHLLLVGFVLSCVPLLISFFIKHFRITQLLLDSKKKQTLELNKSLFSHLTHLAMFQSVTFRFWFKNSQFSNVSPNT